MYLKLLELKGGALPELAEIGDASADDLLAADRNRDLDRAHVKPIHLEQKAGT